jgi:colicin import membrane protein
MSLASDRPEFTPPTQRRGTMRAIGFAILAHAVLIAALTWGVGWKRESANAPVQAELWSTTVQQAAPALVEPSTLPPSQIEPKTEPKPEPQPVPVPKVAPPTPKPPKVAAPEPEPTIDPQIAIEKAKKEKEKKKELEKKKAAEAKALAKQQAEDEAEEEARLEALDKKKRALEAKKLETKKAAEAKKVADAKTAAIAAANDTKYEASLKAAREANLKRIAGIAGASGGETATGTAKQSTGPSAGYGGRVSARVKPNIVFTAEVSGNIEAGVEVRTSPDGTITGRKIIKSSGNKAWDDAVLRALDKTEILPKDTDGRVPSTIEIYFKPKDLL